jgi:hypothetical protein
MERILLDAIDEAGSSLLCGIASEVTTALLDGACRKLHQFLNQRAR